MQRKDYGYLAISSDDKPGILFKKDARSVVHLSAFSDLENTLSRASSASLV